MIFLVLWQARCFSVPGNRGKEYELGSHYRVASHWVFFNLLEFFWLKFFGLELFRNVQYKSLQTQCTANNCTEDSALKTPHWGTSALRNKYWGTCNNEHHEKHIYLFWEVSLGKFSVTNFLSVPRIVSHRKFAVTDFVVTNFLVTVFFLVPVSLNLSVTEK